MTKDADDEVRQQRSEFFTGSPLLVVGDGLAYGTRVRGPL